MPSTFRAFLQSKNVQPNHSFNERDESHFVAALLMLRLGFHDTLGHAALDAVATLADDTGDPLASIRGGPETTNALLFVSTFMCFFKVKPRSFMQAVQEFNQYFIPGFADDVGKRIQLFSLVNAAFSQAPMDVSEWPTFESFFRSWKEERKPQLAEQS
jgi:hypothetical protein